MNIAAVKRLPKDPVKPVAQHLLDELSAGVGATARKPKEVEFWGLLLAPTVEVCGPLEGYIHI